MQVHVKNNNHDTLSFKVCHSHMQCCHAQESRHCLKASMEGAFILFQGSIMIMNKSKMAITFNRFFVTLIASQMFANGK